VLVIAARHFASVTDNGAHWPKSSWQAELQIERRDRAGWRDALSSCGTRYEGLELPRLFETIPVAVLRSE
jgi:hypothetical protein